MQSLLFQGANNYHNIFFLYSRAQEVRHGGKPKEVSPHDKFAPTSTELDRVRPQPDCGRFHVDIRMDATVG